MPTIVQTVQGRVTGLWGHALVRGADGKTRALKLDDLVVRGDVILTTQDGIVQLTPEDTTPHRNAHIGGNQVMGLSKASTSRAAGIGTGAGCDSERAIGRGYV